MIRRSLIDTAFAVTCFLSFCMPAVAGAGDTLHIIHWDELQQEGLLTAGEVVATDAPHANVLKIRHEGPGPEVFQLCEMIDPGIVELNYAVTGDVRYENVEGTAFLEMLSYFPDGQWFFSRTLAEVGPLSSIRGTSGWRQFQLPGSLGENPDVARPNRLVINLHFEGPGTVYLSGLELAHISRHEIGMATGAWWTDRQAGLVGGIAGSLLGLIGATIGTLAGLGRGRRVVSALLIAMIAVGSVSLLLGIVALMLRQPYAVCYPLFLLGILSTVLGGAMFPVMKQRYHAAEFRRMQALDVG